MSSLTDKKPPLVALLSVAGATDGQSASKDDFGLFEVCGRPLLAWQMLALRQAGVEIFLVEVDSIPGKLLDLADGFRKDGARVEFIRTAKDLQAFLAPETRLIVQAEAHHFSAPVIGELMAKSSSFVATVDGREENAAFERIDLNTRWAGFAQMNASTALALTELPEGWSITSSLLRQAIQGGTPLHAIPQAYVQQGDLLRVTTHTDAAALGNTLLSARAGTASGWIEKHVFGAIAKGLAPSIWRARSGVALSRLSGPVFAGISLGCGLFGWSLASLVMAVFALFAQQLSAVVSGDAENDQGGIWRYLLVWGSLVSAALTVSWAERGYLADTPSFTMIAVALAFIAQKMSLRRWTSALLQSPALLAIALLIALAASLFPQGAKAFVFLQLGLLLIDLYLPVPDDKNSNQA